jgi:hypothetical protein
MTSSEPRNPVTLNNGLTRSHSKVPYEFNDQTKHDYCVAAMRQELKLFKWPFGPHFTLKRDSQPLPGTIDHQQPRRPSAIP